MTCEAERTCFFVNLYNALAMHAFVEYGVPQGLLARLSLMKKATYTLAGSVYSMYEIEHSVLRACAAKPAIIGAGVLLSLAKFGSRDPRHAVRCPPPPLVAYALSVAWSADLLLVQATDSCLLPFCLLALALAVFGRHAYEQPSRF